MSEDAEPPVRAVGAPIANPARLMAIIRFIAEHDTSKIIWGWHADERSDVRDITTEDALRVLRLGESAEKFTPGINPGEWKTKVVAQLKGSRRIGVVVVVMTTDGYLFIKTVEWEDR